MDVVHSTVCMRLMRALMILRAVPNSWSSLLCNRHHTDVANDDGVLPSCWWPHTIGVHVVVCHAKLLVLDMNKHQAEKHDF